MNVLLDLDGTLTDPREGILGCIRHALAGLGRAAPPDAELEHCIGPPLQESFATLLECSDAARIDAAVALYRERFASTGMYENAVYPGIPVALATLAERGAALYVATSKPHVFATQIVRHFGLDGFFHAVYGGELDGTRSDKSKLIAHVLAVESLPPAATRMVGDRRHDVAGARANGVFPVGVLWGYGSREELLAAGAGALCDHPGMLVEVLEQA